MSESATLIGNWRGRGRKPLSQLAKGLPVLVKRPPSPRPSPPGEGEAISQPAPVAKPVSSAEAQEARDRLLALAAATETDRPIALPKTKRRECPQCRGQGWVWLMNLATLQREIGDCPSCGKNRPKEQPDLRREAGTGRRWHKFA